MFEVVLPDYFKKFQPNFKFVKTEKIPKLHNFKNHAFGSHFKTDFCPFLVETEKKSHYHKSIQVDSEDQFFPPKNISFQLLSFSC